MKKWYNYPKYRPEDKCRFCKHQAVVHFEMKNFGMDNQMGRWDKCDNAIFDAERGTALCNCPGFASVDNLLYLEMQYEEKI